MSRSSVFLMFAAAATIAACDTAFPPRIANLVPTAPDTTVTLKISPASVQLTVGQTFQFTTNATASQAAQIQWGSLQSNIAAVSPSGLVTAFAPGSATITARFSFDTTQVATATVHVIGATP